MLGSYASGHSLHVRVTQTLRLINKKTRLLSKSSAKVVKYFDLIFFYGLLVNICQHRQHV